MSLDSAFWVWNLVANMAYGLRYQEVYPLILERIVQIESKLHADVAVMDAKAATLISTDPNAAVEALTVFSNQAGQQTLQLWKQFWMSLFVRFRDGFTVTSPELPQCTQGQTTSCTSRVTPVAGETGYSQPWYDRIVAESGDHYAVPVSENVPERQRMNERKLARMEKRRH